MTQWQKINQVFEDADKLKKLEDLYMERGNVSRDDARRWALKQFQKPVKGDIDPSYNDP